MFRLTGDREQDCAEALAHYYAVRARYESSDQEAPPWTPESRLEFLLDTDRDTELLFLESAYPDYDELSDRDAGETRDLFDGNVQFMAEEAITGKEAGKRQLGWSYRDAGN